MPIVKKSKIALWMFMLAGCLQAADFTFNWDKAFPESGEKILFKDGENRKRVNKDLHIERILRC